MNWTADTYSRKRRVSERDSDEDDYPKGNKRRKMILDDDDDMIYSIGNEIHFTSGIDTDTIERLIRKFSNVIKENLKKFRSDDEKIEIAYIVDSPGGCVSSVLKFVDYLHMVKQKHPYIEFTSIITGTAASAGTIMSIVADKRYITRHATAMIHELSSGNRGKYTHLMSYAKHLTTEHEKLLNIYLENSKKNKEEMEDILNKETWFSAEEYLAHGFVDGIK